MLLSLLSASRVSEVANLREDYFTKYPSVYKIAISYLTKTSQMGILNSVYLRQLIPILKGVIFRWCGKLTSC